MSTSKLQRYTGDQLRQRFTKYGIVENTRPDWLISAKGERLELDFYLERLGVAVEVQGRQHFEFTPIFHASQFDFQEQLRRDQEKLEICQRVGVDLLYVCKRSDVELVLTSCYDALIIPSDDGSRNWKRITGPKLQQAIRENEAILDSKRLPKALGVLRVHAELILTNSRLKTNKARRNARRYTRQVKRIVRTYNVSLDTTNKRALDIVSQYIESI